MNKIRTARIYDPATESDGYRILVDRLWPRGMKKEEARLGLWAKEIAPSNELRRAFHREEMDAAEFARHYREELLQNPAAPEFVDRIRKQQLLGNVTLLSAVKDLSCGYLPVLLEFLAEKGVK